MTRYGGWDDRSTAPGEVLRFDHEVFRWVTVEKSSHRERWAREHMVASGRWSR